MIGKVKINYDGKWYGYKDGWIYEHHLDFDSYHRFIEICNEDLFEQMDEPFQRLAIEIALHTYFQGIITGKNQKTREIKRCLGIDG